MLRNTLQALALGVSKLPKQFGVFSAASPRLFSNLGVAAAAQDAATLPSVDAVEYDDAVKYDEKYVSQITITGYLGRDLQIRKNKFGVVGSATMAMNSGRGKPTTWVDLLISDEQRAREAEPLMRKGTFVQVVGLLDISQRVDDDGNEMPHITVHVQNVDVKARQQQQAEEGADAPPAPPQQQQQRKRQQYLSLPPDVTAPEADADVSQLSKEQQWAHVAAHPSKWWDQRPKKTNPKAPDFKIRDKAQGDVALWIESKGVPAWVAAQAGGEQQQQQQEAPAAASPAPAAAAAAPKARGRPAAAAAPAAADAPAAAAVPAPPADDADVTQLSKEEQWAHVAAYPHRWWDNRTNKRNEKGPDFSLKSKDAKVALWITSKDTPAWAREKFTVMQ